jgi:phosphatidylinositol kinase/protein kinase (PI-3  family)
MWDLRCFIAKSNDDLRLEVCVLQMMETMAEIFTDVGLGSELWLQR